MWTLFRIAFRNVARNRRRTLITLAALLVGVGAAVVTRGLMNGLQRAMPGAPVEPEAVPMADEATLDQLARLRQSVEEREAPRLAEQNTSKPSAGPRG